MLINVKMPTIVGILTFMSLINFVLSRVEHEKKFITSRPGPVNFKSICINCTSIHKIFSISIYKKIYQKALLFSIGTGKQKQKLISSWHGCSLVCVSRH